MVDLFEPVAARLTDADRRALRDLRPGEPGAGGHTIRHRVGHELGPAFAPEIVGDLGAVGIGDEPAHLVRPLGDVPMHLAGALDGVRRTTLDAAAMDVDGLDEADGWRCSPSSCPSRRHLRSSPLNDLQPS